MQGSKPLEDIAVSVNGDDVTHRADVLTEASEDRIADVFSRLADTVAVLDGTRSGAAPVDPWADTSEKEEAEDEELGKESVPLEEQEGVDEPVRMYLREIGKVFLLSGADKKRLARAMEEAKHVEVIEKRWLDGQARLPAGQEILLSLVDEYHHAQKSLKFVCRDMGIKACAISELLANETWRKTVDAEMDFDLASRLAGHLHVDQVDAEQVIVQLSIITHVLQPEHVR